MSERRVALIQAAGTYVGPCLARRLARSGHDLVLHAPRAEQVDELLALGAAVEAVAAADIADGSPEGGERLVARALDRFGRLDSAALSPLRGGNRSIRGRMLDAPLEDVAAIGGYFETTCNVLRPVLRAMQANPPAGGGQIAVFTSDAGARPEAGWSLYGAARAGQNFLIQAIALEHVGDGICLNAIGSKNAVFDGFPMAPPGAATDSSVDYGDWSAPLVAETPLGRLGTMEELAAFSAVLLDGSNRYQTAQYFSFSGGWQSGG